MTCVGGSTVKVWDWIRRERLLALLLIAFPLLWLLTTTPITQLPALVHWHTIAALTGLMILSSAIQWSGMVNYLARHLLRSIHSERLLAAALCSLAAILAAVITNDVALFLVIPLTLALARITRLPIVRLVIFQALAVNAGSALSPIGNPQNIFLWQTSEVGFVAFTLAMLPMALPFILVIGTGILLAFSKRPLSLEALPERAERVNRKIFWPTLAMYPLFLYALEQGQGWIASLLLMIIYAFWQKRRLLEIDWALLLLFVLMFANLGMLTQLSRMHLLAEWLLNLPGLDLTAGVLLSQIISNVPAAIFLEPFSSDWQQLAWGVNIGGFGLAIGSMANLIALRLARQPGLFFQFHLWSIPCLIVTFLLVMLV
jgi:Na+/H+ antiporter NhaD/arsenite permease-like protein